LKEFLKEKRFIKLRSDSKSFTKEKDMELRSKRTRRNRLRKQKQFNNEINTNSKDEFYHNTETSFEVPDAQGKAESSETLGELSKSKKNKEIIEYNQLQKPEVIEQNELSTLHDSNRNFIQSLIGQDSIPFNIITALKVKKKMSKKNSTSSMPSKVEND
jgi:hypothetical protein